MEPYEEIINGETLLRAAPGARHERICAFLHGAISAALISNSVTAILGPRSIIQLSAGTMVRPDLSLVTIATGKPWLIAEIINSADHRADTVIKKALYEDLNVPRLWMIDPRYDNLERYEGTPYGLVLRGILTGREVLRESLLPQLGLRIEELFAV